MMVGSEKKENGLLTGLPFQGRQACYTTQQRRRLAREARNGDKASRGLRRRRWMDVLEALNGMLIKGLGCGLRCKDHHQHQNVPLEMSVISAQTRQLCWPADAPCSTSTTWWLVWTLHLRQKTIQLPQACSQTTEQNNYFVSEFNGNRQSKAKTGIQRRRLR